DVWKYQYFSPVIEKIAGRPPDYFCEGLQRWGGIIHPDDRSLWQQAIGRLRAGEPSQEEYRILTPDNGVRWIRESVLAKPGPDDRFLRLHGVIADITQRK